MNNTEAMLNWLDEEIRLANGDLLTMLQSIRNVVFIEGQRREAEKREVAEAA